MDINIISFEAVTGMTKEQSERLMQIAIEMQKLQTELLTYGIVIEGNISFDNMALNKKN